jgi:lysozyme
VFNIGERAFRGSPTLRRLNEGKPLEAALAMELWRKSDLDGERIVVDALVRRRAAEKALFLRPTGGWIAAPTPVLPPKIDYDAMGLIPLTSPVATRAEMSGERAFAERELEPQALTPEPPTASETAAAAVIERLEALMAEPAAPAATVAAESVEAVAETPAPEPAPPRAQSPVERLPNINFETARPAPRSLMRSLGLLLLGFLGIGLLALGVTLHFESEYDEVLGVSPRTLGLVSAIAGIVCFSIAAYLMLERLGLPRTRRG